jgi:hypothetical protein
MVTFLEDIDDYSGFITVKNVIKCVSNILPVPCSYQYQLIMVILAGAETFSSMRKSTYACMYVFMYAFSASLMSSKPTNPSPDFDEMCYVSLMFKKGKTA